MMNRNVVCGPGQIQRLLVGLQGYLKGVEIDLIPRDFSRPILTVPEAMSRFFSIQDHRQITDLNTLKTSAETFLKDNKQDFEIEETLFMNNISEYAIQSEIT